jgi:hypothetical protein
VLDLKNIEMITRGKNTDLVQEDLGTRIQTGSDRVIECVSKTFLFAYNAVQEVCAIDMRAL